MSEAAPINIPINKQIGNDLKNEYKAILEKHLSERVIKEDKINSWMDNILSDAKEYFIKKYSDYDLFLFCFACPRNVYLYSNSYSLSVVNIDWCDSIYLKLMNYIVVYISFIISIIIWIIKLKHMKMK